MYRSSTIAQDVWPSGSLLRPAVLVLGGSVALALLSQITVPIQPVPITMQTFGVLLIGFLYGSRLGALTVLAYLAEGAVGLPVFANFTGGWGVLVGPTGGYLWGFVIAAFLIGWLVERGWDRNPVWAIGAALAGTVALYVPGLIVLNFYFGSTASLSEFMTSMVVTMGFGLAPFVIGDTLKLLLAVGVVFGIRWELDRRARKRAGGGPDAS